MAIRPLIFWAISLHAILLQLGIKIACNGQPASPIPPAGPGDTVYTLPGCEIFDSFDCLVAKTAFGMPNYCKTYATTTNCVIYLAPSFCGDVDPAKVPDYKGAIEECINAVPLGPCAYKATARACTSDLFLRSRFFNNADPPRITLESGGAGPVIDFELDTLDVVFGGVLDQSWNPKFSSSNYAGQFLIGTLCKTL